MLWPRNFAGYSYGGASPANIVDPGAMLIASAISSRETIDIRDTALDPRAVPAKRRNVRAGRPTGATVFFHPQQNIRNYESRNGRTVEAVVPDEIILAHELVHAIHMARGTVDVLPAVHFCESPAGAQVPEAWAGEEFRTVGFGNWRHLNGTGPSRPDFSEQRIRAQLGIPYRAAYELP